MEQKRRTRTWCGFLLLLVLLAVFLIWNLFAGSVQLSASQIGQILLGGGDDLTQKQISEIILCDQSLYSKYERGERVLPFDLAVKLADYYQVSLDYLFGRSNKRK